ncbi:uncharacterized protein LOC144155000 isoform X2 [Haemaphysalis longicornis]
MKISGMWYNLHDMSGWKSRQRLFIASEDDRLTWLQVDFIGYLEDIKLESAKVLNSGPVESRFSCLRQFNGGNNRVDTRTSVFTAEKLLKVGTLGAARSTNAKQL